MTLENLHTNFIRSNKTGMTGIITDRQVIHSENNFRLIQGVLNGLPVIQTVSIDTFGGADTLQTKYQWIESQKSLDKAWASLIGENA